MNDLKNYTLPELRRLQTKVVYEIGKRSDEQKRVLIKKMSILAKEQGLSLEDIVGRPANIAKAAKAVKVAPRPGKRMSGALRAKAPAYNKLPPKFRNPNNPSETWSGHARQPGWFKDWVNAGKPVSDLMI